jgi:prepilin peptidase CpaA
MPYQELQAMLGLLGRIMFDARTGGLMLLLVIAAVCDCRTHRIPNWLILCGAVFGLIYTTMVPPFAHGTALFPLSGLVVGLLLFLPLYLLRAMGAGDVKLLAMIGTFLGPLETLYVALTIIIAGGVVSIVWVLVRGRMFRMLQNLAPFFQLAVLGPRAGSPSGFRIAPEASAGRLPYALAIAFGTIAYLIGHQLALP